MHITDDRALEYIADYFRALSEPLRLRIVNILRSEGERNVGELTERLGCSQANVSKHLSLLTKQGLVARENRGTAAYYRIEDPAIFALCDLVCGQLGRRFADQAELGRLFAQSPNPPRRRSRS
jgi:DNA-binding transcriptional ArsR family regulator